MNKKKIVLLLFVLLFIPVHTFALDIDNIKDYNTITKTATISNFVDKLPLVESKIANATLTTPQINYVMRGSDVLVAEINVTPFSDFKGFWDGIELYDLNTNTLIAREVTIKYKEYYFDEVVNATVFKWTVFNDSFDISSGRYEIGLFTEVKSGDRVEWIPKMFGVEIEEWAEWDEGLEVGLVSVHKVNETSGTTAYDSFTGIYNFTCQSHWNTTGKIGGSYRLNNEETITGIPMNRTGAFTVVFWANMILGESGGETVLGIGSGTERHRFKYSYSAAYYRNYQVYDNGAWRTVHTDNAVLNQWEMYALRFNSTAGAEDFGYAELCVNGGTCYGYDYVVGSTLPKTSLVIGDDYTDNDKVLNTLIDELLVYNRTLSNTEITQLYNSGTGLTYTPNPLPIVSLNSPQNNSVTTASSVTLNCSAIDDTEILNITLLIDGVNNYSESFSSTNDTSIQVSRTLSEAVYNYSCNSMDNKNETGYSNTYFFTVDDTAPTINITYPLDAGVYLTAPTIVNFTITELSPSYCYLNHTNYTGTTTIPIGCTESNYSLTSSVGQNYYELWVNDSVGYSSADLISFHTFTEDVDYSSSAIESEYTVITLELNSTNISQSNATLKYDSVEYLMGVGSFDGNNTIFNYTVTVPSGAGDTTKYFNISYFINGINYNTSTYSQSVYNIPELDVSTGCTPAALTFILYDEQSRAPLIDGEFEYVFAYGLSNSSEVTSFGSISGEKNFSVCINDSLSNEWTLGRGEVFYRNSSTHVDRRYYVFNGTTLSNSTVTINLYDLLTTEQTSFKLEVESTSLDPYEDIYTTLVRWYPELNEYKVVDMGETDETGSTIIHVETEDVDYRIGVYEKNGSLIYLAKPIRMICLASPCTYTLQINTDETDYTNFLGIDYSFDFNKTSGMWSFVYSDSSLGTDSINLTIYRLSGLYETPICTSTVVGSSGATNCNTSIYTGTLRGDVFVTMNGVEIPLTQRIETITTSAFKSTWGLWLSFFLALVVILALAAMSPLAALAGGVIALIPAVYFGSISIGVLGGIAVLAAIVAHFVKRIN